MAILGYARVSTTMQSSDLQTDALEAAGCEQIWIDEVSGTTLHRPQLESLLKYARSGDTIMVWRLDRIARSVKHLVELMDTFDQRGIHFRCLQDNIDTSTPGGRLIFHIFAALAQFETDLIRERTYAGLAAARSRGRVGGRPSALSKDQFTAIDIMVAQDMSITSIARSLGVSRATIYRYLAKHRDDAMLTSESLG